MKRLSAKYKILVVDDEEKIISSVKSILSRQAEIEVVGCTSTSQALQLFEKNSQQFALVLMDYRLPDLSGADMTKLILKINPHQIVAMYSGDESQDVAIESWRSGAVDFIEKRSSAEATKNKINLCLKKYIESSEVFQESGIMAIYIRHAGIDIKGTTAGLKLLPTKEVMGRVVEMFKPK